MDYNVLEESMNSINNLEENAFINHKEQYVEAKAAVDEFKDNRDYEDLKIKEARSQEEINQAQDELTKIIDDVISFNDSFNSTIMPVDNDNPVMEIKEQETNNENKDLDTTAIDNFLNNISEE